MVRGRRSGTPRTRLPYGPDRARRPLRWRGGHYNGITTRSRRAIDPRRVAPTHPASSARRQKLGPDQRTGARYVKRAPGPPVVGSPGSVCRHGGVGGVTATAGGIAGAWRPGGSRHHPDLPAAPVLRSGSAHDVAAEDLEDRGSQVPGLHVTAPPGPWRRSRPGADEQGSEAGPSLAAGFGVGRQEPRTRHDLRGHARCSAQPGHRLRDGRRDLAEEDDLVAGLHEVDELSGGFGQGHRRGMNVDRRHGRSVLGSRRRRIAIPLRAPCSRAAVGAGGRLTGPDGRGLSRRSSDRPCPARPRSRCRAAR